MTEYHTKYSKINPSLYDSDVRRVKSRKILRVIQDFSKKNTGDSRCLEVGCSTGVNTIFLSDHMLECIGVDIDAPALKHARLHSPSNTGFVEGDAMNLPFGEGVFDIVICNHVYEHLPDSKLLMDEIFRCLKPGGFCYFGAGNKYAVMEGHYKLPFLSWLPRSLSHVYLMVTKKGSRYYEKHLSYFALKRLVRNFSVTDYTIRIIREPDRFGAGDMIKSNSAVTKIPVGLLRASLPLIPTFIFILEKPCRKE